MRDFEDSTLWRISAFERIRQQTGTSGYMRLGGPTVLPSTLMSELGRLERSGEGDDVLEVMAACLRQREAALLYLQHEELVWPITLFPLPMVFHSPRDLSQSVELADLKLLNIEPPGVRPPGHWLTERIGHAEHYRPLLPLMWAVALRGPRRTLLHEIGGTAAYRVIRRLPDELVAPGALGPAVDRLREQSVPLREIATWPGMNVERACRLLNALYVASCLLATRSHPAARAEPGLAQRLFGRRKGR
jgi:hypothetical protein